MELSQAMAAIIARDDLSTEEKLYFRLLREVWEVDESVPPSFVWQHVSAGDVAFFEQFMGLDEGDDHAEAALLAAFREHLPTLRRINSSIAGRHRIGALIHKANLIRASVHQQA